MRDRLRDASGHWARSEQPQAKEALRGSNSTFVPALELRILIYLDRKVVLAFLTGAGVGFINNPFSNPASRSARMPAAFFSAQNRACQMIFDVTGGLFIDGRQPQAVRP